MTWSVYQHWDPLKVCVVGRSYPPEFYSWIQNSRIRMLFEKMAAETEEDLQNIVSFLKRFDITVLRPDLPVENFIDGKFLKPPLTPRDYIGTIGNTLYYNETFFISKNFEAIYNDIKDITWPDCKNFEDFKKLPAGIQQECLNDYQLKTLLKPYILTMYGAGSYDSIINYVAQQGNVIKRNTFKNVKYDVANRAMAIALGYDLYFGTTSVDQDQKKLLNIINNEFTDTRNHIINTGGHIDGCVVPVAPGLVFSTSSIDSLDKTFPGWQVVRIPESSISNLRNFRNLKKKNQGKWWIPGYEHNQTVIDLVETYFGNWVGFVEETVFDINLLIIDSKNIAVIQHNEFIEQVLSQHGITMHVLPLRHRYFWDGGIHCVTSDLHREGARKDYFPERNNV